MRDAAAAWGLESIPWAGLGGSDLQNRNRLPPGGLGGKKRLGGVLGPLFGRGPVGILPPAHCLNQAEDVEPRTAEPFGRRRGSYSSSWEIGSHRVDRTREVP